MSKNIRIHNPQICNSGAVKKKPRTESSGSVRKPMPSQKDYGQLLVVKDKTAILNPALKDESG